MNGMSAIIACRPDSWSACSFDSLLACVKNEDHTPKQISIYGRIKIRNIHNEEVKCHL